MWCCLMWTVSLILLTFSSSNFLFGYSVSEKLDKGQPHTSQTKKKGLGCRWTLPTSSLKERLQHDLTLVSQQRTSPETCVQRKPSSIVSTVHGATLFLSNYCCLHSQLSSLEQNQGSQQCFQDFHMTFVVCGEET